MSIKYLFIISLLLIPAFLFGGSENTNEPQPEGRIIHIPITSALDNENLIISARMDGTPKRVMFMRLYYKTSDQQSFQFINMASSPSGYVGVLTKSQFGPPVLEYFILALMEDQSVITLPERNPYGNPNIVNVQPVSGSGETPAPSPSVPVPPAGEVDQQFNREPADDPATGSPDQDISVDDAVLVLSPENGEVFETTEEVLIAVSFLPTDNPLEMSSINLFINGVNVTREIELTEFLLTYTTDNLPEGQYRIVMNGLYQSGAEFPTMSWSFQVVGDSEQPQFYTPGTSPVRGRIFAESRNENISGASFTDNNIGGNVFGEYGIAKYEAKAYLTTRESERFQPRNRYTFKLDIPVLGVTLGDTYPRFNDLMLWGKRVRGVHGRVHFGFINYDIIYGQTLRKTPLLTDVVTNPVTGDTLLASDGISDSLRVRQFGNHSQNLFGHRLSFGSGKNFQLGFNYLKVRDDTTSLNPGEFVRQPQDNLVVGSDFLLAFDRRRFEFRAGVAMSMLTNDISTGVLSKQEIKDQFDEDIPFDPAEFDQYLIINSSTVPLVPWELTSLAWNFNFRLNYFKNNFQFGYKRIGPEYTSLGNSFLRNNIQGFYVRDRIRLYQNRIYLNLGFENYKDNFNPDETTVDPGLADTSTKLRTISTGFSIYPGQGFPNLTFDLRNHNRDNDVDTVSTVSGLDNRENNTSRDVTVQLNYDVSLLNVNHNISFSYITSNRDDFFSVSKDTSGLPSTETSSNVQVFSVRTQYEIPLITTINFARNDNSFGSFVPGAPNNFNFTMFGAKAEYRLMEQRLLTYFGINFTSASGRTATDTTAASVSSITDYNRTAFNMGAQYEFQGGHRIYLDASIIGFNDDGSTLDTTTGTLIPNPSYTDRIVRLYYEKRF